MGDKPLVLHGKDISTLISALILAKAHPQMPQVIMMAPERSKLSQVRLSAQAWETIKSLRDMDDADDAQFFAELDPTHQPFTAGAREEKPVLIPGDALEAFAMRKLKLLPKIRWIDGAVWDKLDPDNGVIHYHQEGNATPQSLDYQLLFDAHDQRWMTLSDFERVRATDNTVSSFRARDGIVGTAVIPAPVHCAFAPGDPQSIDPESCRPFGWKRDEPPKFWVLPQRGKEGTYYAVHAELPPALLADYHRDRPAYTERLEGWVNHLMKSAYGAQPVKLTTDLADLTALEDEDAAAKDKQHFLTRAYPMIRQETTPPVLFIDTAPIVVSGAVLEKGPGFMPYRFEDVMTDATHLAWSIRPDHTFDAKRFNNLQRQRNEETFKNHDLLRALTKKRLAMDRLWIESLQRLYALAREKGQEGVLSQLDNLAGIMVNNYGEEVLDTFDMIRDILFSLVMARFQGDWGDVDDELFELLEEGARLFALIASLGQIEYQDVSELEEVMRLMASGEPEFQLLLKPYNDIFLKLIDDAVTRQELNKHQKDLLMLPEPVRLFCESVMGLKGRFHNLQQQAPEKAQESVMKQVLQQMPRLEGDPVYYDRACRWLEARMDYAFPFRNEVLEVLAKQRTLEVESKMKNLVPPTPTLENSSD